MKGIVRCVWWLLAGVSTVCADERSARFASLPNWSGLWEQAARPDSTPVEGAPVGFADAAKVSLAGHPPYNAAWEAKSAAIAGTLGSQSDIKMCEFGFPGLMESPLMFEVLVTPEETALMFEGQEERHIYTDGRSHPKPQDLWPTPVGDSIGRWEGTTLVIDTIARKAGRIYMSPQYIISDQAHFVERVRRTDPDHMEDDMTIEDPLAFSKAWHVVLRYQRVRDVDRLLYQDCTENDRNPIVNGKTTIAPP